MHVGTLQIPVDHYDNSQAYADFGGGHGHNEKHENLPVRIGTVGRESDQKQVYCVQHQLDRHENDDGIAPEQYARHADYK